jgi:hypothetical protein
VFPGIRYRVNGINLECESQDLLQLTYSLLIPCFRTLKLQKPAIHAAFRAREKKFPVFFPVIGNIEQNLIEKSICRNENQFSNYRKG